MKIGKAEKQILQILSEPYPEHPQPIHLVGGIPLPRPIYGYPRRGSDTKHLAEIIFGDDAFSHLENLKPKIQATLSRSLNNLCRKGLVEKLPAQANNPRLYNEAVSVIDFPLGTKFWWVLSDGDKG